MTPEGTLVYFINLAKSPFLNFLPQKLSIKVTKCFKSAL